MDDIHRILTFWLEEVGPQGWYAVDAAVDARIRREFEPLWHDAIAGRLGPWQTTANGILAYLILTDQFSRNIFRGTGDAYAGDRTARAVAKAAIGRGMDTRIAEPARQFFYLPLMHSEILADQELCICRILTAMPETGAGQNLPHAVKHRAVIRRFGRFPSRNAALGRTDSDAELAYRAEGGYMG